MNFCPLFHKSSRKIHFFLDSIIDHRIYVPRILSFDQVGDGGGDALLMASLTMSGFERQLYHFDEWPRQESRCLSFAAIR